VADKAVKQALFDEFARVGKALSSGRRAEMIDVLANGERKVEALAEQVNLSVANVSQHLQILRAAGLVTSRREGTSIYYRLAGPEVVTLWRAVQQLAADRLAVVDRLARAYLGEDNGVEAVTKEDLARRLRKKEDFVILDVRPHDEFTAGHIPGAISIPVDELRRRLKELPKGKHVIAYCRGSYCAFAPEAIRILMKKGYKASLLNEGWPDWASAGLPVEATD